MNRILFAAKHVYTVLRMGRPLFVVGSHFICRPRGGLSVSEKDKKMHGLIMVLISSLRVVLLISLDKSCHFTEPIVNRRDWLWSPANIKGADKKCHARFMLEGPRQCAIFCFILIQYASFYWLVPQDRINRYCVLCRVKGKNRTTTYNKELWRVS